MTERSTGSPSAVEPVPASVVAETGGAEGRHRRRRDGPPSSPVAPNFQAAMTSTVTARMPTRATTTAWDSARLRRGTAPVAGGDHGLLGEREARVVLVDVELAVEAEPLRVRPQEALDVRVARERVEPLLLESAKVPRSNLRLRLELARARGPCGRERRAGCCRSRTRWGIVTASTGGLPSATGERRGGPEIPFVAETRIRVRASSASVRAAASGS